MIKYYKSVVQFKTNYPGWSTAFVFIAIVCFLTVLLYCNYKPSYQNTDQVYSKYYAPAKLNETIIKKINNVPKLLEVVELYGKKEYKEAYSLLVSVNTDNTDRDTVNYIYGNIFMALEDYDAANNAFSSLINIRHKDYYTEALWYRALCYLKSGDIINAEKDFKKARSVSARYKSKIREILQDLPPEKLKKS